MVENNKNTEEVCVFASSVFYELFHLNISFMYFLYDIRYLR